MERTNPGSAGVPPARPGAAEWHSRGYLPHFDRPGLVQMITFRLADALPAEMLSDPLPSPNPGQSERLVARGVNGSPVWCQPRADDLARRRRLEALLDAGHGACYLRDARIAWLVQRALLHFDGSRYRLIAWVVMPNHVHVLVEMHNGHPLASIVQAWKSFAAHEANKLLQRRGVFWQPEYFDRATRDERHLVAAIDYVHNNPVKAGLVSEAGDWAWSSARLWAEEGQPSVPVTLVGGEARRAGRPRSQGGLRQTPMEARWPGG
jgi:REP element-mobilizing transposase RayT